MLTLSNLSPHPGSRKQKKRIGRGQGTGQGKTAGRGHKGFKARSGSGIKPGFEGGQMPLQRRLPKRGFTNIFKKQYAIVNLRDLAQFEASTRVDRQALLEAGLISSGDRFVKILGDGEIASALTVAVDKVSAAARQKIESANGKVEAAE
jgi:large subunit ribosomal protein L15